ncbi:MAG: DUF1573 domain-containing protein [Flavobacteriales bacterium]|nr:DUF1573 domain-containing protein [Flavobacteriales bacterium]
MSQGRKFGIIALTALCFGAFSLTSCQEDKPTSHAVANAEGEAASGNEATQEKFDPLKGQKDQQQEVKADIPLTTVSFSEYEWDFGTIDEGDKVEHTFKFTNTGNEPLVLEKCKGSCGCTVPTCPKDPIPPGGTGEIGVVFNSKGKKNSQTKRVSITCNTEEQPVLKIHAQVTPEDEVEG